MATVTFQVDVAAFEAAARDFLDTVIIVVQLEQWAVAELFMQRVKLRTPVRT